MLKRVLFDGANLAHRMRHVHKNLRSEAGRPTGVLFGVLGAMHKAIEEFAPDEIVVAWEGSGTAWRKDIFPGYKEGRKRKAAQASKKDREAIKEFFDIQIPDTRWALRNLGVPQIAIPRVEGDDVIAMLVARYTPDNLRNVIISTDRDFIQLVRPRCRVLNPITGKLYYYSGGAVHVEGEEFAPSPTCYLHRRIIAGDASDSLPGIRGIGPKISEKLFPTNVLGVGMGDVRVEKFIASGEWALMETLMSLQHGGQVEAHVSTAGPMLKSLYFKMLGKGNIPIFLRGGIERFDPSPFTTFFGKRDLAVSNSKLQRIVMIDMYRALYRSRRSVVNAVRIDQGLEKG